MPGFGTDFLNRLTFIIAVTCPLQILASENGGRKWFTQKPVVVRSAPAGSKTVSHNTFVLPTGFQVERLFTVSKEELGSWVSIAFDDQGRIIASDQHDKGLCRITPAPIASDLPTKVEHLDIDVSSAQGMLYAFDSLYLSVVAESGSGLYRARDTNDDDQYDEIVKLKDFHFGGEHSPHALRLSPDGNSIYVVSGNHTDLPKGAVSNCIPNNWSEDLLLPRQWDARGHAYGRLAPGGWIAKTDPDGKKWEVISIGYRNSYDMAFNADGELFAYDSDMEWDLGLPWYRPTRIVHTTDGSEFGWRSGTGKWPPYYIDSLPPMINIGPGSPVGITFGYGAKFPAKYQRALFACDWTFGTMYTIDIQPRGASYEAVKEEFLSCTPLPLTDIAVGPDGAIYFATGGRGTQSGLFRLTYVGQESTEPVETRDTKCADLRHLRRKLEQLHSSSEDPAGAVDFIWPHLTHEDRHIRYAARVALERQDVKSWQKRALAATRPQALITAAVALARQGEKSLQPELIAALNQIDFGRLEQSQQLDLLRVYQLVFIRMGEPDANTSLQLVQRLNTFYPGPTDALNRELSALLVYLKSPTVISKTLELLQQETEPSATDISEMLARNSDFGPTIADMLANQPDRQKIYYAFVLRNLKSGWTLNQRTSYFDFLQKARKWSGGESYQGFITNLDREAFENATESERLAIEASGARKPYQPPELPKPIGPGSDWTLDRLLTIAKDGLKERDFKNGQKMFLAARCVVCHRFAGDGGATGPDLTQAAGRFALKDLCEAIIEPSKVVSDQYLASIIMTTEGTVHSGRIVNETNDSMTILIDPENSTKVVTVLLIEIDQSRPSAVSMMPNGLLNPLNEREVLDLLAYILSRGEASDPMFHK